MHMYQRNDDPQLLDVRQAFAGAQHDDIIKVIPYCPYCFEGTYLNAEVKPAQYIDGAWMHELVWADWPRTGTVLCKRYP